MSLLAVRATVVALIVLAILNPAGHAAAVVKAENPGNYDDVRLDRYLGKVRRYLGPRVGFIEIDTSRGLVVKIGAVDLTPEDGERLRRLAPRKYTVRPYETKYSERQLEDFARRARRALHSAGLGDTFNGVQLERADEITVVVADESAEAREALREELPRGSYELVEGPGATLHSDGFEWPLDPLMSSVGLLIVLGLTVLGIRARRKHPSSLPESPT